MKRSILSAGEFMIQSNDEKSEEEAFKREENVSRRASEQIRHEGNAVVQNNICSNFEIQRNDIESGIQGNVYNSPVTYCAENRPQKDGRHRKFKPASIVMCEIKQAGLQVPFLPTGMQSEIYQNNTVGCNELQLNCCNNTREQVTCSGGKRSSGIDRRRKFNPTSVVNFETEHDGPKVLFLQDVCTQMCFLVTLRVATISREKTTNPRVTICKRNWSPATVKKDPVALNNIES